MQLFSWNTEFLTNILTTSSSRKMDGSDSINVDGGGSESGGGAGAVDWEHTPQPIVKLFYEDLLFIEQPTHRQQ